MLDWPAEHVFEFLFAGGNFFAGQLDWQSGQSRVGECVRSDFITCRQPLLHLSNARQRRGRVALTLLLLIHPSHQVRNQKHHRSESILMQHSRCVLDDVAKPVVKCQINVPGGVGAATCRCVIRGCGKPGCFQLANLPAEHALGHVQALQADTAWALPDMMVHQDRSPC